MTVCCRAFVWGVAYAVIALQLLHWIAWQQHTPSPGVNVPVPPFITFLSLGTSFLIALMSICLG